MAGLLSKTGKMRRPMSPTCTLFGMPPRAMTTQFSNSNGGIGRAVSPLTAAGCQRARSGSPRRRARSDAPYHASRTTKPRPARQSIRFPAGANVAQAVGHDALAWAKYQCQSWSMICFTIGFREPIRKSTWIPVGRVFENWFLKFENRPIKLVCPVSPISASVSLVLNAKTSENVSLSKDIVVIL